MTPLESVIGYTLAAAVISVIIILNVHVWKSTTNPIQSKSRKKS